MTEDRTGEVNPMPKNAVYFEADISQDKDGSKRTYMIYDREYNFTKVHRPDLGVSLVGNQHT
jgi:hypothetical protein